MKRAKDQGRNQKSIGCAVRSDRSIILCSGFWRLVGCQNLLLVRRVSRSHRGSPPVRRDLFRFRSASSSRRYLRSPIQIAATVPAALISVYFIPDIQDSYCTIDAGEEWERSMSPITSWSYVVGDVAGRDVRVSCLHVSAEHGLSSNARIGSARYMVQISSSSQCGCGVMVRLRCAWMKGLIQTSVYDSHSLDLLFVCNGYSCSVQMRQGLHNDLLGTIACYIRILVRLVFLPSYEFYRVDALIFYSSRFASGAQGSDNPPYTIPIFQMNHHLSLVI